MTPALSALLGPSRSRFSPRVDLATDASQGLLDHRLRYIEVRACAHALAGEREVYALQPHALDERKRREARAGRIEEHKVGLRLLHGHARQLPQAARQDLGVAVIMREAIDVVIEGMYAGCGANAGLAQTTSTALLPTPSRIDELSTAGKHCAQRRS